MDEWFNRCTDGQTLLEVRELVLKSPAGLERVNNLSTDIAPLVIESSRVPSSSPTEENRYPSCTASVYKAPVP